MAIPNYASAPHHGSPPTVAIGRAVVAFVIILVAIIVSASHTTLDATLQTTADTALQPTPHTVLDLSKCIGRHRYKCNYENPLAQHGD